MGDCNCTFSQKTVGDGCLQCNPDYWIDSLESQVKELQEEKQALKQNQRVAFFAIRWIYLLCKFRGLKNMSKYTTLVFQSDTPDSLEQVREMSGREICRAWSMDHEILRLELIEQALDKNDIELAQSYISEPDVTIFKDRLTA